jgi:hypothetical protein
MNVLVGCDFFTVEVLSWRGLVTYYALFFLHPESRLVHIARITKHPDQEWMEQIGRSATRVGKGSDNAIIAPAGFPSPSARLGLPDLKKTGGPGILPMFGAVEFLGDQFPVPSQDRIGGNLARKIRFSAARYSFRNRSSWFTEPVTSAGRRTHLLFLMPTYLILPRVI